MTKPPNRWLSILVGFLLMVLGVINGAFAQEKPEGDQDAGN